MSINSASNQRATAFPTTHWNLVIQATEGQEEEASLALDEICNAYWQPIFAYLSARGFSKQDAEDLTQGYFSSVLRRQSLNHADSQRGKLRTFFLSDLKRFIADQKRHDSAQKRGGKAHFESLDENLEREAFANESIDPETLYMKAWATTLIERATDSLKENYAASGKENVFELIADYLYGKNEGIPYPEIAIALKTSISAARLTVFRLRQRFRAMLESEIAHTVESTNQVGEEIDFLFQAVAARH